jgi:glycosyltransferase involved in cell wall biosynthesis
MRIAVDLSPAVHHHAGIGRYAHELVTALTAHDHANEYVAFYNAPRGDECPDAPLDRLPAYVRRASAKRLRFQVLLAHLTGATLDHWLPPCDLFHATDYLLPPLRRARAVLTIYDLTYLFFPEYHLPLNRWYLTLMLPRLARCADAIIAISENTRRDLMRLIKLPTEKISVIPLGVNRAFQPIQDPRELIRVRAKYKLPPCFILYFGTIEPRKNLLTLLDAYRVLLTNDPATPDLVIAGNKGWLYQPVLKRVRELGLAERVRFTNWIDEQDAPALMNAAAVFVYPSLYEGFGLPPLEAMACGTPVVCSNASSLPEVVGDGGVLVEPRDAGGFAQAIARTLGDQVLRAKLRHQGLEQASKFSWERTARETLAVYETAFQSQNAHRH